MNKQSGFTLIELLITLVIISLTVALIASSFNLGLKSWSGASKKIEEYQQIRVCLDMMSSKIRNAFISPLNRNLTFKGDRYSLDFITTSPTEGLTKVHFGMKKKEEEFLWIKEKSEQIFTIEFMYYDSKNGEWREDWDSLKLMRLPLAVKISISSINGKEIKKMTIPEMVIMIPGGMKPIKEKVETEMISEFYKYS